MIRIYIRMIPGDPVVIWEQTYRGNWSRFVWDSVDNTLDVASYVSGNWQHTETFYLTGR